jgi:hypothetical protein
VADPVRDNPDPRPRRWTAILASDGQSRLIRVSAARPYRRTIIAKPMLRQPRGYCDRWQQRLPHGFRSGRCRFGLTITPTRHPRVDPNEYKIGNRDSRRGDAVGRLLTGTAAILWTPAGMGSRRGRPGSYQLCRICETRTAPRSTQLSRDDRVHR